MTPKVSVIIPAFNCDSYIHDSITSILTQSFSNFEVIIIDDGSTDKTNSIINELAISDSRINILRTKNLGIVSALNLGISKSKGEYIARMDGDDIAHPTRIEHQVSLLDSDPNLIACGSNIEKFGAYSDITKYPIDSATCKLTLLFENCFAHPTVMFKKNKLSLNSNIYSEKYMYAEDYYLWSRLVEHGNLKNIRTPLLKYRIHSQQTGSKKRNIQTTSHIHISQENMSKIGLHYEFESLRKIIFPNGYLERLYSVIHLMNIFLKLLNLKYSFSSVTFIILKMLKRTVLGSKNYV